MAMMTMRLSTSMTVSRFVGFYGVVVGFGGGLGCVFLGEFWCMGDLWLKSVC